MAVKTTKQHEKNAKVVVQMEDADICVKVLSKLGLEVQKVEIGALPVPRIEVNREPPDVESGIIRLNGSARGRVTTHATKMHHCQVEWRKAG